MHISDVAQYIVEEIEKNHGLRIAEVVMKVFLKFGWERKQTELYIEDMIKEGYVWCLDYHCMDFDRWYGFLLTGKYSIEIYSKERMIRVSR